MKSLPEAWALWQESTAASATKEEEVALVEVEVVQEVVVVQEVEVVQEVQEVARLNDDGAVM
jgi:hypothetical protein